MQKWGIWYDVHPYGEPIGINAGPNRWVKASDTGEAPTDMMPRLFNDKDEAEAFAEAFSKENSVFECDQHPGSYLIITYQVKQYTSLN